MPTRTKLTKAEIGALVNTTHHEPRSLLGYHEFPRADGTPLCMVRVLEPGAEVDRGVLGRRRPASCIQLKRMHDAGLFEGSIPYRRPLMPYRLRVRFPCDHEVVKHDTYFFSHELSDFDLHLFGEGRHYGLYHKFGAHPRVRDGVAGTHFAVWAPNAQRVSVVGSFNIWDGRKHAMQARGGSGVWELFVPGVGEGADYKYEIRTQRGRLLLKSDPFGFRMQLRPETASIVASLDGYEWQRRRTGCATRAQRDWRRSPINIYEVHLSSWQHSWDRQPPFYTWAEAAEQLIPYVVDMGYTHIELMGVAEHPFDGSLGLPGGGLLRADLALRHAEGIHGLRRQVPPGRHRRDPRLGARRIFRRTRTVSPSSTAPRSTNTPTRASASTATGAPRSSTTAATR